MKVKVKPMRAAILSNVGKRTRRRTRPDVQEQVLRAATLYLIQKHGMFLVATDAREMSIRGLRVWIISVTLRFAEEHEGYVGDLLYDGREFMFLTPQSVIDERARLIAEDPDALRKWNEYRASTLHAGEE